MSLVVLLDVATELECDAVNFVSALTESVKESELVVVGTLTATVFLDRETTGEEVHVAENGDRVTVVREGEAVIELLNVVLCVGDMVV